LQGENGPPDENQFRQREFSHMFEEINDEIALITANAKFNFTTCKINGNTLKLTLAYLEDTKKLVEILKERIKLLSEATS
jgi:hypothetical protein